MDLCVWAQNKTKVHHAGLRRRTKSKVVGRSTSKQMVTCFFGKTGHVATVSLEHSRAVYSDRCGTPQFVCLKSSKKFEKRTREEESLFNMAMRAHTSVQIINFSLAKTWNWLVIRRTALTWHSMTSFFSAHHEKMRAKRLSSSEDTVVVLKNHILELS